MLSSRRDFLKTSFRGASLIALAPTVPGFLAGTALATSSEADARVLVVIQLDGGNDGINTVVPYRDEGYAKYRKVLRLPADKLIKVVEGVGLHPSLDEAAKLLEAGWLSIVPGVSYPNPSRSHFRSMAVWQTARLDPEEHQGPGWIGRVGDEVASAGAIFLGSETPPAALRGRRSIPGSIDRLRDFMLPRLHRPETGGRRRSVADERAFCLRPAQPARCLHDGRPHCRADAQRKVRRA